MFCVVHFQKTLDLGTQNSCFLLAVNVWEGAGTLSELTSGFRNQNSQDSRQLKESSLKVGTVGVWTEQQP